jgi:hypothetical protein
MLAWIEALISRLSAYCLGFRRAICHGIISMASFDRMTCSLSSLPEAVVIPAAVEAVSPIPSDQDSARDSCARVNISPNCGEGERGRRFSGGTSPGGLVLKQRLRRDSSAWVAPVGQIEARWRRAY